MCYSFRTVTTTIIFIDVFKICTGSYMDTCLLPNCHGLKRLSFVLFCHVHKIRQPHPKSKRFVI